MRVDRPVDGASDGELWDRACRGEAECFGVLFDRHAEAVRAFCARRTGSLYEADDLVSIVFLEAWRRRADVELVDDNALPWLYGVARRTIQHRWRTAARHRRALARLPRAGTSADHADEVAGRVDDQQHLAQVQRALQTLSPIHQEVLILCVWQELDYASAAVSLGVPIGTVVRGRDLCAVVLLAVPTSCAVSCGDPGSDESQPG